MASPLDYGRLGLPQRLMLIRNRLIVHGIDVVVTRAMTFNNEYADTVQPEMIYPDEVDPELPDSVIPTFDPENAVTIETRAIIDKPVGGLGGLDIFDDRIELSDKLDLVYKITTIEPLELEDRLDFTWPDGKKMTIRVTRIHRDHPYSEVANMAEGLPI
jgi:hypothetical protein